jgi:hypothetical protein
MNGETSVADYKNHNPKRELASNGFGKCNVRGKQKRSNHNFKGPATERKQRSAETPTFAQLPPPPLVIGTTSSPQSRKLTSPRNAAPAVHAANEPIQSVTYGHNVVIELPGFA